LIKNISIQEIITKAIIMQFKKLKDNKFEEVKPVMEGDLIRSISGAFSN